MAEPNEQNPNQNQDQTPDVSNFISGVKLTKNPPKPNSTQDQGDEGGQSPDPTHSALRSLDPSNPG